MPLVPRYRVLVARVALLDFVVSLQSEDHRLPEQRRAVVFELVVDDEEDRGELGDFDIIITDLKMPDMDGIEFLRAARQFYPEIGKRHSKIRKKGGERPR